MRPKHELLATVMDEDYASFVRPKFDHAAQDLIGQHNDLYHEPKRSLVVALSDSVTGMPWPTETRRLRANVVRTGYFLKGFVSEALDRGQGDSSVIDGLCGEAESILLQSSRAAVEASKVRSYGDRLRLKKSARLLGKSAVPIGAGVSAVAAGKMVIFVAPAVAGATYAGLVMVREMGKQVASAIAKNSTNKLLIKSTAELFSPVNSAVMQAAATEFDRFEQLYGRKLTIEETADLVRSIEVRFIGNGLNKDLRGVFQYGRENKLPNPTISKLAVHQTLNTITDKANVVRVFGYVDTTVAAQLVIDKPE